MSKGLSAILRGFKRTGLPAIGFGAAALAVALSGAPAMAADRLDALELEMKELKKENIELRERVDTIEAGDEETSHSLGQLSRLVDVSGYADVEYRLTDKDGQNGGFRLHHLSLFFTKDIQKDWKLFSEIEFEDAPVLDYTNNTMNRANGVFFVEQMYIEYHRSLSWDLRFGRFLTPAGIWSIYHYPPYVPTQSSPLFAKVIFPEVSDGALLRNSFSLADTAVDTHLFASNGSGNPGSLDLNTNTAVGARVNAAFTHSLSAGASYFREKDNSDVMKNSFALHLLASYGPFDFQTEYAYRHNDPDAGVSFNDKGWYGQLSLDVGKWTFAGRADWYDSNDTNSDNDTYRYTGAVNYHFAHNVVGKLEYDRNEYDDPTKQDYNEVIFAIVVAIGDL